jgi:hypothetical protein
VKGAAERPHPYTCPNLHSEFGGEINNIILGKFLNDRGYEFTLCRFLFWLGARDVLKKVTEREEKTVLETGR